MIEFLSETRYCEIQLAFTFSQMTSWLFRTHGSPIRKYYYSEQDVTNVCTNVLELFSPVVERRKSSNDLFCVYF